MKKKLLMGYLALTAATVIGLSGCSVASIAAPKYVKEANELWGNDGSEAREVEINGEFYLYGKIYTFPVPMSDLLENGWHIRNNLKDKDTFELKPGYETTEFELFRDDDSKKFISVKVTNMTTENANLQDCMVTYLEARVNDIDFVMPGGVYYKTPYDDIKKYYPDPEEDESNGVLKFNYRFTTEDDWKCNLQMQIWGKQNNSSVTLARVVFTLDDSEENWNKLDEATANATSFEEYMNTYMNTYYHGDYGKYISEKYGLMSDATEGHENELQYSAYLIMDYSGIDYEYVSDDLIDQFEDYTEDALKYYTSWTISDVVFDDATNSGTFNLNIQPSNVFALLDGGICDDAYDAFYEKYSDVDFNTISEEAYSEVMEYYGTQVLKELKNKRGLKKSEDVIVKTYPFDYNNGIIQAETWDDISLTMVGYSPEE